MLLNSFDQAGVLDLDDERADDVEAFLEADVCRGGGGGLLEVVNGEASYLLEPGELEFVEDEERLVEPTVATVLAVERVGSPVDHAQLVPRPIGRLLVDECAVLDEQNAVNALLELSHVDGCALELCDEHLLPLSRNHRLRDSRHQVARHRQLFLRQCRLSFLRHKRLHPLHQLLHAKQRRRQLSQRVQRCHIFVREQLLVCAHSRLRPPSPPLHELRSLLRLRSHAQSNHTQHLYEWVHSLFAPLLYF